MNDNTDLRSQVERLEMLEKARNHVFEYARAVDAGEIAQLVELFSVDGTLSVPAGDHEGRERIREFFTARAGVSRKRHFITNVQPRVTGEREVTVESYFLFTSQETELSGLGWGTYTDVIDFTSEDPVFVRKTITPIVNSTLGQGWQL